jgi:hypothetical protein
MAGLARVLGSASSTNRLDLLSNLPSLDSIAVVLVGLLWLPIRYNFVSVQLAGLGAFWVRMKWVTIPIGVFVLFRQGRYVAVTVALLTPRLTGLLNAPGKVGVVQQKFLDSSL